MINEQSQRKWIFENVLSDSDVFLLILFKISFVLKLRYSVKTMTI